MKLKKTSLIFGVATALTVSMLGGCKGPKPTAGSHSQTPSSPAQAPKKVEFPYTKALEAVCKEFPEAAEGLKEAQDYHAALFSERLGEANAKDAASMIVFQKLLAQSTVEELMFDEQNRKIYKALIENGIHVQWTESNGLFFSEN